jgi:hypothetical protein
MAEYGDEETIRQLSRLTFADLGLATDADFTDLIQRLNERASEAIDSYCNRDFLLHAGDVAILDGDDRRTIALPGYPVISIAEVKENDDVVDADDYRVAGHTKPGVNSGILERRHGHLWRFDWRNLEVTYDWGFTAPPGGVQAVAEAIVIRALHAAKTAVQSGGISSYSMDGFSVAFLDVAMRAATLQASDKEALVLYRQVAVA